MGLTPACNVITQNAQQGIVEAEKLPTSDMMLLRQIDQKVVLRSGNSTKRLLFFLLLSILYQLHVILGKNANARRNSFFCVVENAVFSDRYIRRDVGKQ